MKMKKGFTLIELLVVIAIIGILSTIAVIALQSARTKSRDAKRVADIKQVQTALEMCFSDSACADGGYPVLATGAVPAIASYMTTAPTAPTPADNTCTPGDHTVTPPVLGTNDYQYQSTDSAGTAACGTAPCAGYKMQFCIGAATGDMAAGVHCVTPTGIAAGACTWGT